MGQVVSWTEQTIEYDGQTATWQIGRDADGNYAAFDKRTDPLPKAIWDAPRNRWVENARNKDEVPLPWWSSLLSQNNGAYSIPPDVAAAYDPQTKNLGTGGLVIKLNTTQIKALGRDIKTPGNIPLASLKVGDTIMLAPPANIKPPPLPPWITSGKVSWKKENEYIPAKVAEVTPTLIPIVAIVIVLIIAAIILVSVAMCLYYVYALHVYDYTPQKTGEYDIDGDGVNDAESWYTPAGGKNVYHIIRTFTYKEKTYNFCDTWAVEWAPPAPPLYKPIDWTKVATYGIIAAAAIGALAVVIYLATRKKKGEGVTIVTTPPPPPPPPPAQTAYTPMPR